MWRRGTPLHLANRGFEVYGIDASRRAIEIAKNSFREENLEGEFKVCSMYNGLPYRGSFFDAIISIRTIHHGRISQIRRIIKEMERVLKRGGILFMTVGRGMPRRLMTKSRFLDPRIYIPLEGEKKELSITSFNKKSLMGEFRNFRVHGIEIEPDEHHPSYEGYYCLLAQLI